MQALASGQPVRAAFERAVGVSLDAFETAFKRYVKNPRFNFAWFESQDVGERQLGSQRGKLSVAATETLKATLMNDSVKIQKSLDTALSAEPDYRPALVLRATRLVAARETALAAGDLARLAAADESDLQLCGLAMFALNVLGRFDEALATCPQAKKDVGINFERVVSLEATNRAREIGPLFATLLQAQAEELDVLNWRSWRYLEEGRYMAAIRAADLLSARARGTPDGVAYQRFVKTVSACLSSLCPDARADLKRASIPPGASEWVQNVFRFLTEQIDADALLKEALRVEEQTEGHTYVALDLIARGKVKDAMPHLAWVAQKGSANVTEYFVALAHLKRLEKP